VEADVDGHRVLVGSAAFLAQAGVAEVPELAEPSAATVVLIAIDGAHRATVAFADPVRSEAQASLAQLRARGIAVVIASGDRSAAVGAVADRLGVAERYAGLDPAAKLALVARLRATGRRVAMVGAGLNDAAACAGADLALAVAGGADALARAGHAVVHRLDGVGAVLDLGQRTRAIIRTNLAWAFGYNLVAIPLATGLAQPWVGFLIDPMVAGVAMAGSSLAVVLNSLRLRRWRQMRYSAT
jgi:Cu+-exporting ATPase